MLHGCKIRQNSHCLEPRKYKSTNLTSFYYHPGKRVVWMGGGVCVMYHVCHFVSVRRRETKHQSKAHTSGLKKWHYNLYATFTIVIVYILHGTSHDTWSIIDILPISKYTASPEESKLKKGYNKCVWASVWVSMHKREVGIWKDFVVSVFGEEVETKLNHATLREVQLWQMSDIICLLLLFFLCVCVSLYALTSRSFSPWSYGAS